MDISFYLMAVGAALSLNSIALSEIFLALGIFIAIVEHIKEKRSIFYHVSYLPLILFVFWSVLSVIFSENIYVGFNGLRKVWILLALCFLPGTLKNFKEKKINFFVNFLALSLSVSSIYAIYQFLTTSNPILHRIKGFSDHPMTFSGTLSLSLIFLVIYLFESRSKNYFILISVILGFFALIFSLTRCYWIAVAISLIFYFLMKRKFKFLLFFIGTVTLFFLISPHFVKYRAEHILDYRESGNKARIEMWKAGIKMIEKHPFFGVGINMVKIEGSKYLKNPDFPIGFFMHLHNDYLQMAAERGIPALIFYIIFFMMLLYYFFIFFRKHKSSNIIIFSKSLFFVLITFLVAGFFEYNFGDSEVFILLVFLVSMPFSLFENEELENEKA